MAAATTKVTIPATGTYQLDPASTSIAFNTRHIFGLGPVKGTFALRTGSIHVAEQPTRSRVSVSVDAASFATGNPKRDAQVSSSDFLDVQHHPEIIFASTGLSKTAEGWVLRGEITARGVVAPVELRVLEVAVDGDAVTARMTGTVDRYAHSMTKLKGMAGRYLTLVITARAVRV
jgi:polyisoprenoid-binding protein YceI